MAEEEGQEEEQEEEQEMSEAMEGEEGTMIAMRMRRDTLRKDGRTREKTSRMVGEEEEEEGGNRMGDGMVTEDLLHVEYT